MPSSDTPIRKLAAIMFTDIAGYTALSAKDSLKASELLKTQKDTLKPIVEEHGGSWMKEMGDGLLLIFDSATSAVECAIAIQGATKDMEDLNLRIGIHEGEVIKRDDDVIGDDVNVASRIEPFSAVGGIAISDKVFRAISSNKEFDTKYVGTPNLKGVSQKVEVYCITSHGLPETKLSDVSAKLEKEKHEKYKWNIFTYTGLALTVIGVGFWISVSFLGISFGGENEVPSIGILMMENKGSDEDTFWAEGITEDLIIKVAGAGLIRVSPMKEIKEIKMKDSFKDIANQLRVKYLLTSSIYKHGNGFDLRCQLIEAESGNSKYANKWSESLDNSPTIVGNLAENILNILQIKTTQTITESVSTKPESYEFYLKAKYIYDKRESMEGTEIARGFLRKAIEMDDKMILAKNLLGLTYYETSDYEKALEIYTGSLIQAEELGNKKGMAKSLEYIGLIHWRKYDNNNALEYYNRSFEIYEELGDKGGMGSLLNAKGIIYMRKGDKEKALEFYNRSFSIAEELDDKNQMGKTLNNIGVVYSKKSDYDLALEYQFRSLKINEEIGRKRGIGFAFGNIGRFYYFKGDYEQALDYQNRSLNIREELGDKRGITLSLFNIGTVHYKIYELNKAIDFFTLSYKMANEIGNKGNVGYSKLYIAFIHAVRGDYAEALEYLSHSIKIIEELGDKNDLARAIKQYGIVCFLQQDFSKALENLKKSGAMQMENKKSISLSTNLYLALVYKKLGKSYDLRDILEQVEKEEEIEDYGLNFRLYQLLEDISYLETSYDQVQEQAEELESKIRENFLSYPIPKAIIEEWNSLQIDSSG